MNSILLEVTAIIQFFLTIVLVCTILIGMILQTLHSWSIKKKGTITDIDDLLGENSLTSKLSEN